MRLVVLLITALALLSACGGDDDTSPVQLTLVNTSGQAVDISINGEHSSLDAGDEDAVTLSGSKEYRILVMGQNGGTLYTDTLTPSEIREMGGRIVIQPVAVSPG